MYINAQVKHLRNKDYIMTTEEQAFVKRSNTTTVVMYLFMAFVLGIFAFIRWESDEVVKSIVTMNETQLELKETINELKVELDSLRLKQAYMRLDVRVQGIKLEKLNENGSF